ncbi:hypothetical protein EV356DRAFT_568466 [Viridothelium virens]|uniref:LITAF domain-containing protein n=1 Tax=Viridothelium virens TaxID=1048519 RepID=A0A6A6H3V6_VIRVR|nr:hypothetical protein EV356DRAFT_568466 [Viridothelium virens]
MNSDSKPPQGEIQPVELHNMDQGPSKPPNYVSAIQNDGAETKTPAPNATDAPQMRPPPQRVDYEVPFGPRPIPIHCPFCQQESTSTVHTVVGGVTLAWAAGCCFLLLLGCIPFCIDYCKNVEHSCGNCHRSVATWHRASGFTEIHPWGSQQEIPSQNQK